ncbi:MAG TPA: site-specific integrase, partial [Candidatus Saccharimonadales bacterium]|nr:site-specific integrase [Candidatus Saccharimonadales bacterium]
EAAIMIEGHRHRRVAQRKHEVSAWLVELRKTQLDGLPVTPPRRQTVASFFATWMADRRSQVKYSTWIRDEQYGRLHLLPVLGKLQLSKLGPQDVQRMQERMLRGGASPTSVHHAHAVLHRMLRDAVRWDLVSRNVAQLVSPPRMAESNIEVLRREQVDALLEVAASDPWEALWVLALGTGMREGELMALRWQDLDLEAGLVQVRRTASRGPEGMIFAEPKTPNSRRRIKLGQGELAALHRHHAAQAAARLQVGPLWQEQDLVFCQADGQPILRERIFRTAFRQLLARAGLPVITFHNLRHTHATLLLLAGVNAKVVSERLGHASVAFTLRVYSHVLPEMQEQAATAWDNLFLRAT